MSWNRYSNYKESENEWIGEIPKHWYIQKLKYVAKITLSSVDKKLNEDEKAVQLCNYVDVYYNSFITSDLELMQGSATDSEIMRFELKQGDVIITKDSESWDDIAIPAYVPSDFAGTVCGYHLALIRTNTDFLIGSYLFRALEARGINDQFRVAANGVTRYGLGKYWIDNSYFAIPPVEEQQAIVDFLDKKTAKIEQLISKVEILAGKINDTDSSLLKEYRTALITAAVTGKIDVRRETA